MTEPKPYRVEVTVHTPREAVWRALTDPEQIREWFGWDYDESGGLDAEIQYIFVDHAEAQPPDRIALDLGQYLELESAGPRTIVRAVMPGPLAEADWDDLYNEIEEGWRQFFEQLRFRLERRPAGRRRTVQLSGTAHPARALAALEPVAKEVWHDSRYHRIVVDGDGHLVGVHGHQPLDVPGTAPLSLTVSTYGLDDAAFAAVRDEWTARWSQVTEAG